MIEVYVALALMLFAFGAVVGNAIERRIANRQLAEQREKLLYIMRPTKNLNEYARLCHESSVKGGWWHNLTTGEPLDRNRGEMLMLMVSEIAEAMEGERKSKMDDKLPHRQMAEVELADALIRIFDYAAGFGYDLEGAFREKLLYNQTREDHKLENRRLADGKKF